MLGVYLLFDGYYKRSKSKNLVRIILSSNAVTVVIRLCKHPSLCSTHCWSCRYM